MNKGDLGRQREGRILVAEEEILHEINVCSLAASSKRRSGNSSKQGHSKSSSAFLGCSLHCKQWQAF
jgi:hypothetical protein